MLFGYIFKFYFIENRVVCLENVIISNFCLLVFFQRMGEMYRGVNIAQLR